MPNMVNLRVDPEKERTPLDLDTKPAFPPGTVITLAGAALGGMGIEGLPQVGQKLTMAGAVEVVGVEQPETVMGGEPMVRLQITDIALGKDEEKKDAGEVLYGAGDMPT